MSQEPSLPQRPTDDTRMYWRARNEHWRTEPEIDQTRQDFLTQQRSIQPNITLKVYPFKDIKLNRADVEWLLSAHENCGVVGPVQWTDVNQSGREGLDLRGADLRGIDLENLPLAGMRGGLHGAEWGTTEENREAAAIHLEGANLHYTRLDGAHLASAHFEGANLSEVHFEGADLYGAHLEAKESPTDFDLAYFDAATKIENVSLANRRGVGPRFADARLNGLNLGTANWSSVKELGDEFESRKEYHWEGRQKGRELRLIESRRAVRAYRQMALALRESGLNEEADRFTYRAHVCQRRVYLRERRFGRYLRSWFFYLLAGYGYRPSQTFLTYGLVIATFAVLYLLNAQFAAPHLDWQEALVLSVSSFHGRGFFPSSTHLGDTLAQLAALEAFAGLIIEVTIIATFTQRYFGK